MKQVLEESLSTIQVLIARGFCAGCRKPEDLHRTSTIGCLFALVFLTLCLPFAARADNTQFPDSAFIYLQKNDGSELTIGQVSFSEPVDGKSSYTIDIDNGVFTDHFLSMRPFRCLESAEEWFCYLPYPYELRRSVSADDLTDLEYDLLFIKKLPSEFGIDAWNGLYYSLTLSDDGHIVGKLLEGDLNSLQSPPENTFDRPIELEEFIEASTTKRLFPTLVIR